MQFSLRVIEVTPTHVFRTARNVSSSSRCVIVELSDGAYDGQLFDDAWLEGIKHRGWWILPLNGLPLRELQCKYVQDRKWQANQQPNVEYEILLRLVDDQPAAVAAVVDAFEDEGDRSDRRQDRRPAGRHVGD